MEAGVGATLPTYLKNLLFLNGFDNAVALSSLTEEHIDMLEIFARNDLSDFVDADRPLTNYYGIYVKKIGSFKIVAGHRVLLKRLSGHCKELIQGIAVGTNNKRRPPPNKNVPDNTMDDSNNGKNLTEVEKKLIKTIKTNINTLAKENKIELKQKNCDALRNLVVQVKKSTSGSGKSEFETKIPCIFCVQRISSYYSQGRWIIGNYTRHLSTVHRTRGATPMEAFVVDVDPSIVHLNVASASEDENGTQSVDSEIDNISKAKKRKVNPADPKVVRDSFQHQESSTSNGDGNEENF